MHPVRVDLTMRLADSLGVLDRLRTVPAPVADDDLIRTVHDDDLVRAVTRLGHEGGVDLAHGLGSEDNPVFRGMHEATAHVVGASVEAFRQVWSGESLHSANVTGGLHHAMPGRASGFCVYNDVAVGIRHLLDLGATRVAYVDVDAHHGDGVQKGSGTTPRVRPSPCTRPARCSSPAPGSPPTPEAPTPRAPRSTSPCASAPPTPAGCAPSTPSSRRCCASGSPRCSSASTAATPHVEDPLTHLNLTVTVATARRTRRSTSSRHEVAGGRWVVTGGGGYALVDVVPRSWSHLLAIMTGTPLEPSLATPAVLARPRHAQPRAAAPCA